MAQELLSSLLAMRQVKLTDFNNDGNNNKITVVHIKKINMSSVVAVEPPAIATEPPATVIEPLADSVIKEPS